MMSERQVLHWGRVRSARDYAAVAVATSLGAGLFPKAPGTMGTLFGVPLAYFTRDWPIFTRLLLWTTLTIAGTWSAKVMDELMGTGDNQCIVIDEVVGLGITSWAITSGAALPWAAAFLLFRLFDITKIFPVRLADSWSKTKAKEGTTAARWWGGFGVMLDDILAGFQGLLVMILLQNFFHLF